MGRSHQPRAFNALSGSLDMPVTLSSGRSHFERNEAKKGITPYVRAGKEGAANDGNSRVWEVAGRPLPAVVILHCLSGLIEACQSSKVYLITAGHNPPSSCVYLTAISNSTISVCHCIP